MVDGVIGVSGKLVQLAVEEDTKTEQDYVITRLHCLEVTIAQSMAPLTLKVKDATITHARVC